MCKLSVQALIVAPVILLLICSVWRPAQARWKSAYNNSPYQAWYTQQHDGEGWSCCNHSDAHAIYDAYLKRGAWYVRIDGLEHRIQPDQLLAGPNPTGHGVLWYSGVGSHVSIFCFAPGALY